MVGIKENIENIFLICYFISAQFVGMANTAKTFKDLIVWQKAHRFVLATYSLTASFPRCEIYCLTSQMRRASISVPANIAEGFKKRGVSDKTRFLNFAQGSLEEYRYYLILIQDLDTVPQQIWRPSWKKSPSCCCLRERNRVQPVSHSKLLNS